MFLLHTKQHFVCFLFIISIVFPALSQRVDSIPIRIYSQKEGLLQLNVSTLAKDQDGYIWTGVQEGLHRFNGYEFTPFVNDDNDPTSIPDNHIKDILAKGDTLWVASNTEGLIGRKLTSGSFFRASNVPDNENLSAGHHVFNVDANHILYSAKNALLLYNVSSSTSSYVVLPYKQQENFVTGVIKLSDKELLIATINTGLYILNLDSFALRAVYTDLPTSTVRCLARSGDMIFAGTDLGLLTLSSRNREDFTASSLTEDIQVIFPKDERYLLVGTNLTAATYDTQKDSYSSHRFKDEDGKMYYPLLVHDIYRDDKQNFWFGTRGEGLFHHNPYQKKFDTHKLSFKEYPTMDRISSYQFLKENDEEIWVTCSFGVAKYNLRTRKSKLYKAGQGVLVYALRKDKNGTLWAGGYGQGLLKYNRDTDSFKQYKGDPDDVFSLPDNEVIEIIPIDANTLWVCTWSGGIAAFNIEKEIFSPIQIIGKTLNRARIAYQEEDGTLWLGAETGLYKRSPDGLTKHYTKDDNNKDKRLTDNRVFGIVPDKNGILWISTMDGLTSLDPKTEKIQRFKRQKGLPNLVLYSVEVDDANQVWVSSNQGISVYNQKKKSFTNYTVKDGLQNNEFNGKSSYKDENGLLYFGGVDGFNIFDPKVIKENPFVPEIKLEAVELFNEPVSTARLQEEVLTFNSNENVLTFTYAALNFLNAEKCNYQYMMDGFDEDWRPITKDRSTTYTNLDPGDYTFKVKASNDVGRWNPEVLTKEIRIIPPWYKQTWFRVLAVFLLLAAGVLYFFYKTYQLKRDKRRLALLVEERTSEVQNKNMALQEAYEISESQRENISFLMKELRHRVKNNLQVVSSLLNIQAKSISDEDAQKALHVAKNRILTIAHIQEQLSEGKEAIRLAPFIQELSKTILRSLSIKDPLFKTAFDLEQDILVSGDASTLIGLVLNELITNTSKYAFTRFRESNTLSITSKKAGDTIVIIVADNGVGYTPSDMRQNSLGLELVYEMVSQLGGEITTTAEDGVTHQIELSIHKIAPKPE